MGFFDRLKQGLKKTQENVGARINEVVSVFRKVDEELLDELEEILIVSDMGIETSGKVIEELRKNVKLKGIEDAEQVKDELKSIIQKIIDIEVEEEKLPRCILVVGVNGAGKTTSIGKIASKYVAQGKKVLVVPADTFRAAAGEQLLEWSKRAGADITEIREGEDPSATVYRSLEYAKSQKYDIILVDTAGRLHNKKNLMEELKKINNTVDKLLDEQYVKETLLVLDGTTGQNAIEQSKAFGEVANIDGYILTKLDGTSKGGVIVGIVERTKLPIRYIGVGEKVEDLQKFDAQEFIDAVFK